MSVTDRYTQSRTRLHKSVTKLDTSTALWPVGGAALRMRTLLRLGLKVRRVRWINESYTNPKSATWRASAVGSSTDNKQTRVLIGSPEEYVHGHTLPIMPTQIITRNAER